MRKKPAVVTAYKDKASVVRAVAKSLNFTYAEQDVPNEADVIRFIFSLDKTDTDGLVKSLPVEIFAYRAVTGRAG